MNKVFNLIKAEQLRQKHSVNLIASEKFVSQQVMEATGSHLTNKYAEGLPYKRYYAGCEVVDQIEEIAIDLAKQLFKASWTNVQPHSGSSANAALMLGVLKPGDKLLGFDLAHGGHLTHGSPVNFSGKFYNAYFYGVDRATGRVDYEGLETKARKHKPKLIICGASSYSRDWDYKRIRTIADEVDAWLLGDVSHTSGLIVSGLLNSPFPHCHFVTTTTHKTLRGPRGGMILMDEDRTNPWGLQDKKGKLRPMSSLLDSAVFPGRQGGPLMHVIAAKAVAFAEALRPKFVRYSEQVQRNASSMAESFRDRGYDLVSGGTDNHLILLDLTRKGLSGRRAERALDRAGITVNKNMVPFDERSPFVTSGIRLGTPALTTRGLKEEDMLRIVAWVDDILHAPDDEKLAKQIKNEASRRMGGFPLFAE